MDDKITSILDRVIKLCEQNTEFKNELQKGMGIASSADRLYMDDDRLNQIFEYCIEKIIRKQAAEFYVDFPIKSIVPSLIEDFVRMESFRRKDQFGDFCLSLYQQIECITNNLCESDVLSNIVKKMWGCPAWVKSGKDIEPRINNRVDESTTTIADLVFPGLDKKAGLPNSIVKSQQALQTLYAYDKIRAIVYFLGYRATMKNSDYDYYVEITTSIKEVYQCRNMNHRGNTLTSWEEDTIRKILPMKSYYYFKFMGVLAQYVNSVKIGINYVPEIENYANTIIPAKIHVNGPKVLGKIELPDNNKKRFK